MPGERAQFAPAFGVPQPRAVVTTPGQHARAIGRKRNARHGTQRPLRPARGERASVCGRAAERAHERGTLDVGCGKQGAVRGIGPGEREVRLIETVATFDAAAAPVAIAQFGGRKIDVFKLRFTKTGIHGGERSRIHTHKHGVDHFRVGRVRCGECSVG